MTRLPLEVTYFLHILSISTILCIIISDEIWIFCTQALCTFKLFPRYILLWVAGRRGGGAYVFVFVVLPCLLLINIQKPLSFLFSFLSLRLFIANIGILLFVECFGFFSSLPCICSCFLGDFFFRSYSCNSIVQLLVFKFKIWLLGPKKGIFVGFFLETLVKDKRV